MIVSNSLSEGSRTIFPEPLPWYENKRRITMEVMFTLDNVWDCGLLVKALGKLE